MKKSIYLVLTLISLVLLGLTIYDYNRVLNNRLKNADDIGTATALASKNHLDSIFWLVKNTTDSLAKEISSNHYTEAELKEIIHASIIKMPFLLGIAVAYEPYVFNPDKRLFSLFFDQKKEKFLRIEDKYGYRDSSLLTANWYVKPAASLKPYLSKPYFGEVSEELVNDYSVPMFIEVNGINEFIGVITASISLDHFTEVVNSFIQGKSDYIFITNSDGDYIIHPNRSYTIKENIFERLASDKAKLSAIKGFAEPSGSIEFNSKYTGTASILYHQTTELTKWKVVVVYSRTDLLGNPKILEQRIIHIALAASFLILFTLILLLKLYQDKTYQLWIIAIIITALFVLNITIIWIITLDLDYSEELENRSRVYSENALHSYVAKKNYEQKLLGKSEYITIPTGTFIEELLVTDSYNMSMSGKIWQKWPVDHDLKDNKGFHFLQASPNGRSVIVELLSKDRIDSATWLYTWKFSATLRIFFDYRQYPLDQHYIDIKLIYPDMTDKIMLIPDFPSYEVLNPSSKPGMSDIIFLPRHRIIASYFSFSSMDMKTFFGQDRETHNSESQLLEYVIVIKRRFITPFISFVIPFILGSLIIFFLLYSLNKDKNDNSGVTVMGVVQGMAALFFSMLLAHITIRNKIPTPEITYLETYYFVIYIMIFLLILIVVMYSKSTKYKFLNYRDNLMVKLIYWPLLFGLIYIITLIKFY